jgi:hypothetical protein
VILQKGRPRENADGLSFGKVPFSGETLGGLKNKTFAFFDMRRRPV